MDHHYFLTYPVLTISYNSAVHSLFNHLKVDTMPIELRKLSEKLL
jgi:hypothetical protein